jgi:hypothetical protein
MSAKFHVPVPRMRRELDHALSPSRKEDPPKSPARVAD